MNGLIWIAGAAAGAAIGVYIGFKRWLCPSGGGCPLTSNPYAAGLYGAVLGAALAAACSKPAEKAEQPSPAPAPAAETVQADAEAPGVLDAETAPPAEPAAQPAAAEPEAAAPAPPAAVEEPPAPEPPVDLGPPAEEQELPAANTEEPAGESAAAEDAAVVILASAAEFDALLANSAQPVLVDFWATWCPPCKLQGPVVEEFAKNNSGTVKVAKLDVDQVPEVAQRLGVSAIPTLIVFRNGGETKRLVGFSEIEKLQKAVFGG